MATHHCALPGTAEAPMPTGTVPVDTVLYLGRKQGRPRSVTNEALLLEEMQRRGLHSSLRRGVPPNVSLIGSLLSSLITRSFHTLLARRSLDAESTARGAD